MADKQSVVKKQVKQAAEVKTVDQLREEVVVKQAELLAARRGLAAGELTNPRVVTHTKKDIARLLTAIRAAEIAAKESK
jgi:ribosomal protein L29